MTVITQRPGITGAEKIRLLPAGEKVFAREKETQPGIFVCVDVQPKNGAQKCQSRSELRRCTHIHL